MEALRLASEPLILHSSPHFARMLIAATEIDDSGIPWALLAREQDSELICRAGNVTNALKRQSRIGRQLRGDGDRKPALKGLRRANRVQWLKPEIRIRAQHLKAKGTLRHATVKQLS